MAYIDRAKRGVHIFFSYFSTKIYVVGTHSKRLAQALLMSNHNICFRVEIRNIL